jgi:hypothetical protein
VTPVSGSAAGLEKQKFSASKRTPLATNVHRSMARCSPGGAIMAPAPPTRELHRNVCSLEPRRRPLAAFLGRRLIASSEIENGRGRAALGDDLPFPASDSR